MPPPRAAASAFLTAALGIRPGEGRRTGVLFIHLFLASSVFILGRTVRDTLFLSRYPIKYLPWMFVLYGVASALTALVYGRYADRVPRQRMILAWVALGISTYLATWGLVRSGAEWIYPAFYVWTDVVANLFIVQFWTLANDLFDARSAKRLFGTIGAARVLGVVVMGVVTSAIVRVIGTTQLLFLLVGLMAGIAGCATLLTRETRADPGERGGAPPPRRGGAPPPRRGGAPAVLRDPYVRALAVMILLIFVALTIGDYQFKRIARATFREDDLARFFSLFYAGVGTIAFVFQLVVTPRLLRRYGVEAGMAVMPSVFGAAAAALLFVPKLAVVTVQKFADNGFQYGVHETTFQALYVPFAPQVKARTRAFLDAIVNPLACGVGGLALVFLVPHLGVNRLGVVTLPIVAAWLAMIPVVRRRYVRRLEATLSSRGALALDHEYTLDAAGRRALLAVLAHGAPDQVLVALEQFGPDDSPEIRNAAAALAAHPDPAVRAAALYRLAAHGGAAADPAPARAALGDPSPDVRAAAVAAFAALARDDAVDLVTPLLADPAADVRVAALVGLLRDGGVEGGLVGGAELARLLGGPRDDRIAAARALRHLGRSAYHPLHRLLDDPDAAVRRAALKAASGVADPRLVPVLLRLMDDPAARRAAGNALIAVGPAVVAPLADALARGLPPRPVRLEIPRLLRHIAVPESYAALRPLTEADDSHVRLRAYAALSALRRRLGRAAEPLPFIQGLVRAEIAETYRNQLGWEAARPRFCNELLDDEFAFRRQRAVRRILRLLELRYERDALRLVREHLQDPARRPNALETLDATLDAPLRPLVMPFLDEVPDAERRRRALGFVGAVPDPVEFMRATCAHPNPYVTALALDALWRAGEPAALAEALALRDHPDPLVRETAMVVSGAGLPEGQMYSTLEKILLMRRARIFDRVRGEDLVPLARIAEPRVYAAGETVLREGDRADALFIVVRGRVAISRHGQPVAELGAGETIGEMAVLGHETRSASATAVEETEALWIGNEEFYEILHEQVEIAEGVIRMLSDRLRETTEELGRLKQELVER